MERPGEAWEFLLHPLSRRWQFQGLVGPAMGFGITECWVPFEIPVVPPCSRSLRKLVQTSAVVRYCRLICTPPGVPLVTT